MFGLVSAHYGINSIRTAVIQEGMRLHTLSPSPGNALTYSIIVVRFIYMDSTIANPALRYDVRPVISLVCVVQILM